MKKLFGFTLAEVLITLGIIGVVAALTIPSLMANVNSAKYKSQYKKDLSLLNHAVRMSEANYETNFAYTSVMCGGGDWTKGGEDNPDSISSVCSIFNTTLAGATYHNPTSSLKLPNSTKYTLHDENGAALDYYDYQVAYTLADGSIISFNPQFYGCSLDYKDLSGTPSVCSLFIDVNGTAPPNRVVSCKNSADNGYIYPTGADSSLVSEGSSDCVVDNSSMRDTFKAVMYDGTVIPFTRASMAVLQDKK